MDQRFHTGIRIRISDGASGRAGDIGIIDSRFISPPEGPVNPATRDSQTSWVILFPDGERWPYREENMVIIEDKKAGLVDKIQR